LPVGANQFDFERSGRLVLPADAKEKKGDQPEVNGNGEDEGESFSRLFLADAASAHRLELPD
jgi:hypothetical protein